MSTERKCFFYKPKRAKVGCKKLAKYRVIFGDGLTIDVCEDHVEQYRILGLKILGLKELEV